MQSPLPNQQHAHSRKRQNEGFSSSAPGPLQAKTQEMIVLLGAGSDLQSFAGAKVDANRRSKIPINWERLYR